MFKLYLDAILSANFGTLFIYAPFDDDKTPNVAKKVCKTEIYVVDSRLKKQRERIFMANIIWFIYGQVINIKTRSAPCSNLINS